MHTMSIMSATEGDAKVRWSPEDARAVSAAEQEFTRMTGGGFTAFKIIDADRNTQRMDKFDPTATEIVLIPKLFGG